MGVGDGVEDWNSESGEDDGDGAWCEDEVEEVIQPTSTTGVSAKYILLLPERNEDNENKAGCNPFLPNVTLSYFLSNVTPPPNPDPGLD